MYDRMCGIIEDELRKIAEKGLTTANLDVTFKMTDMLKDLKQIEYWDTVENGMEQGRKNYNDEGEYRKYGYSRRSNRYDDSYNDDDKHYNRGF